MKEESKIDKLIKILVFVAGISQLVLSQVHISAISKLFVKEVGFYLFMFILFGIILVPMVISFNDEHAKTYVTSILFLVVTIVLGVITVVLMNNSLSDPQTKATFQDIQWSFLLIGGAEILNIGSLVLTTLRCVGIARKEKEYARLAREQ